MEHHMRNFIALFLLCFFITANCAEASYQPPCGSSGQIQYNNSGVCGAYSANAAVTYLNAITALTGDVAASGPGSVVSTIQPNAVTDSKLATGTANSLLGYSNTGAAVTVTAGSGITISGNTITATSGGGGTVTTSGSPASGNLTKFSGAAIITNADLSGDVTTSGTLVSTVSKIAGTTVSGTTGSGNVAFSASPVFTGSPTLSTASATSINKVALTAPASGSTLTIADGKTLTSSNTLTLTGTDASSVAFGAGGTVAYTANNLSVFAATTSAQLAGVISDETGTGSLVFGTAPTITLANGTGLPVSTGISGLGTGVATALGVNTGSAGAVVLFNGAGGTPSSLTATNLSGTASSLTSGLTNALKSATTMVDVSAATAPSANQILTATDSTHATWQAAQTSPVFSGSSAVASAFSATPTFSLAATSSKSPVRFEPGAMTSNVTAVTFSNKTAGAKYSIAWLQDATGGRTIAYGASVSSNTTCGVPDPGVSVLSIQQFEVESDGATVDCTGFNTFPAWRGLAATESSTAPTTLAGTDFLYTNSSTHRFNQLLNGGSADTVLGAATTDTLTNKTYDTAGTGNSFKVNGVSLVNYPYRSIGVTIDGGGSAITTGFKGNWTAPFACTIVSATLTSDVSGSIVIDVWKNNAVIPTVTNTITASALPTLSSATYAQDTTLTGWTKTVAKNDVFGYNVNSASTLTKATLVLGCQ